VERLEIVHKVFQTVLGFLLDPLSDQHAIWSILWVSFLTAILALLMYRLLSSPQAIQHAKIRVKAHILEMRLFQEDPVLMGKAIRSMVGANLSYMRLHLKPFLGMLLPVMLLLVHSEARFGYRPFLPGEKVLVRSFWKSDLQPGSGRVYELLPGGGLEVESPPLRLVSDREVDWRLKTFEAGNLRFALKGPEQSFSGSVLVSNELLPVTRKSYAKRSWESLVDPASEPLADRGDLIALEIDYPRRHWTLAGHGIEWIWLFFLFSIASGYALKDVFRVEL